MSWREEFGQLARTIDTVFPGENELEAKLALGRPLRVKFGIDITSTSVTIGNEIPLRILDRFAEMGHEATLILGNFTTLVGDPTGKDKTRPVLTAEDVERNGQSWLDQLSGIIDLERMEIRRNSEWLAALTPQDFIRLTGQLTVAQMLERESFSKRYREQSPIHLHEFLYCLLQGYDSVALQSDIELGGTDQTFNLNIGRILQRHAGQEPQVCVINTLLEGVDGHKKMSKSLGNAIGLDTEPKDMFGLATRVPDEIVRKYMELATDLSGDEIDALLADGNIWKAKKTMAGAIVARHYGAEIAVKEHQEFERIFAKKETPDDMPDVKIDANPATPVDWLRTAFDLSGGEAKRLIKQGAVSLDGAKITDAQTPVAIAGGEVLKAGKRKFARLTLS